MGLSAYRAARRRSRTRGLVVASLSTLLCTQALAQEATTELNPINVEGQSDSPVGPDDGYIAKNTTTGSKNRHAAEGNSALDFGGDPQAARRSPAGAA